MQNTKYKINTEIQKGVQKRRRCRHWLLLQCHVMHRHFHSRRLNLIQCSRMWGNLISALQDSIDADKSYLPKALFMMLIQTKIKKENEQLPVFSVVVSSVSDITESVMFKSQRVLIGWFVARVVDLFVFCLNGSKPLGKAFFFFCTNVTD